VRAWSKRVATTHFTTSSKRPGNVLARNNEGTSAGEVFGDVALDIASEEYCAHDEPGI
jgi:hypothetical protein